MIDRNELRGAAISIHYELAKQGDEYALAEVEAALWHWLKESVHDLIEDAEFHVAGAGACFHPSAFAKALRGEVSR